MGKGRGATLLLSNCTQLSNTVSYVQLRDARPAGWVTYCSICTNTMPRAQNRSEKGSILLQRRFTLPILLYYSSMGDHPDALQLRMVIMLTHQLRMVIMLTHQLRKVIMLTHQLRMVIMLTNQLRMLRKPENIQNSQLSTRLKIFAKIQTIALKTTVCFT